MRLIFWGGGRGAIFGRSGENLSEMRGIVQNEISQFLGALASAWRVSNWPWGQSAGQLDEHALAHVELGLWPIPNELGLGRVGYLISIASP